MIEWWLRDEVPPVWHASTGSPSAAARPSAAVSPISRRTGCRKGPTCPVSWHTRLPFSRVWMSPTYGVYLRSRGASWAAAYEQNEAQHAALRASACGPHPHSPPTRPRTHTPPPPPHTRRPPASEIPAPAHPMRLVLSTAVPLVAVSMALRRPSSARVGISYLSRVVPSEPAVGRGVAHRLSRRERKRHSASGTRQAGSTQRPVAGASICNQRGEVTGVAVAGTAAAHPQSCPPSVPCAGP